MEATLARPVQSLPGSAAAVETSPLHYRLAGLAFATVLPTLFWVAVIAEVAPLAGFQMSVASLIITGCVICTFLGSVCAPLVLKPAV